MTLANAEQPTDRRTLHAVETALKNEACDGDDAKATGVISRALRVLDSFGGIGTVYGVSELSRRCELPKSTTFRMVTQLVESGYVRREGSRYALSHHMFTLSNRHDEVTRSAPREIAAPHLGGLFLQTGFAVNFGILRDSEVVIVSQLRGPRMPVLPATVGERMPASTTALGKAILAFSTRARLREALEAELPRLTHNSITTAGRLLDHLKAVHTAGVAFDHQESALGVVCVAAPVVVPGKPTTAISVCGPSAHLDMQTTARLVQQTAQIIAHDLARSGSPAIAV